jgi:hypothetical protein
MGHVPQRWASAKDWSCDAEEGRASVNKTSAKGDAEANEGEINHANGEGTTDGRKDAREAQAYVPEA